MACSIALESCVSIGRSSTPTYGATAWIAPNWPIPAGTSGSRTTATRVTVGAICLRNSSHLPPMLYSNAAVHSTSSAARFISTPIRRIFSGCCARATSGHAAAPPSSVMKSRRFNFAIIRSLVGARLQRLRNGQVENLGCLHVDDKLEAGRLLNREIGWLCTSQDTIDVGCGLPEQVDIVDPVAQK